MSEPRYPTSCVERFLKYVTIDTQSCEDSESFPSTPTQLDLLRLLVEVRSLSITGCFITSGNPTLGYNWEQEEETPQRSMDWIQRSSYVRMLTMPLPALSYRSVMGKLLLSAPAKT